MKSKGQKKKKDKKKQKQKNIRPVLKLGKTTKNFSKNFSQKELIIVGGNSLHVWLE